MDALFRRWDLLFYWVALYVPLNFYLFFVPVNEYALRVHLQMGHYVSDPYIALLLCWFPVELTGLVWMRLSLRYRTHWVTVALLFSTVAFPLLMLSEALPRALTPQPWGFRFPFLFGPAVPPPLPRPERRPAPPPSTAPTQTTHRFQHFELDLPPGFSLTDRQEDAPIRAMDLRGPGGSPLALILVGTPRTLDDTFRSDLARNRPAPSGFQWLEQPDPDTTHPQYRLIAGGLRLAGVDSPYTVLDVFPEARCAPEDRARLDPILETLRIWEPHLKGPAPLRSFPAVRPITP